MLVPEQGGGLMIAIHQFKAGIDPYSVPCDIMMPKMEWEWDGSLRN